MSTYSVSRTFVGDKMFSFNTFSCLGILYMYIPFRPMKINENDRNDLKKRKDLIYSFSLGGKLYETEQTESFFCKSCPCEYLPENRLPILACFDLRRFSK